MIPDAPLKVLLALSLVILALFLDARYEIRQIPDEAGTMEPSVKRRSTHVFRTDGTPPPRGAVVWHEHPLLPTRLHLSRVVGLAGDRIALDGGRLVRNGRTQDEDHVEKRVDLERYPEITVPEGFVFILNDARGDPGSPVADSRRLGPVPLRTILGWTKDRVAEREDGDPPPKKGGRS